MNPAFLRQRLVRIVTRPPELLYALSKHWFLTLFLVTGGTFAGWLVGMAEPKTYEGKAKLHVRSQEPADSYTDDEQALRRNRQLLPTQTSIIESEPVLRETVSHWVPRLFLPDAAEEDPSRNILPEFLRPLVRKIEKLLTFDDVDVQGLDYEGMIQGAVGNFRGRSEVKPIMQSSEVELTLYGTERKRIYEELHHWIEAYRNRVRELAGQRVQSTVRRRDEAYEKVVERARHELETWRRENPDVSEGKVERHNLEILRLQQRRDEILRRLGSDQPVQPEDLSELEKRIRALESRIEDRLAAGIPEDSTEIRTLRRQLESLRAQGDGEGSPGSEKDPSAARREKLNDEIDRLEEELDEHYAARERLKEQIRELDRLESRYERVMALRDVEENRDTLIKHSTVVVETIEEPVVSKSPYKYNPERKVALGAMGGLFFAVCFAIFVEMLCGKVRFKHDVIADFGLPVVVVFPK